MCLDLNPFLLMAQLHFSETFVPWKQKILRIHNVIFNGNMQVVRWGENSMIEAERRLLANALLDFSNQRFVLLSESCIPLFNFSTIYTYLMHSTKTFVEAYDLLGEVGRGRYNHKMSPLVKLSQWRKGSQWFQIDRELAVEIVSDRQYFSVFKKYCNPNCYSDEHYLPTLVSIKFWKKNSNRTLTWVDWSRGGPHPSRYIRTDVTVDFLKRLRHGSRCTYNGKITNICHLFARKFTPHALDRLLRFAPKLMQFSWLFVFAHIYFLYNWSYSFLYMIRLGAKLLATLPICYHFFHKSLQTWYILFLTQKLHVGSLLMHLFLI